MRYFARKVDRNQKAIIDALEAAGCTVQSLHTVGGGCPDLLVGVHRRMWLVEVKAEEAPRSFKDGAKSNEAQTRARQKEWADRWRGAPPLTVRSPAEAVDALGLRARGAFVAGERLYDGR